MLSSPCLKRFPVCHLIDNLSRCHWLNTLYYTVWWLLVTEPDPRTRRSVRGSGSETRWLSEALIGQMVRATVRGREWTTFFFLVLQNVMNIFLFVASVYSLS